MLKQSVVLVIKSNCTTVDITDYNHMHVRNMAKAEMKKKCSFLDWPIKRGPAQNNHSLGMKNL